MNSPPTGFEFRRISKIQLDLIPLLRDVKSTRQHNSFKKRKPNWLESNFKIDRSIIPLRAVRNINIFSSIF